MKLIILLLSLVMALPSLAAESSNDNADKKDSSAAAESKTSKTTDKSQKANKEPGDYSSIYYDVKLPPDWQAILPPTDTQGQVSAVFAKNSSNPSVTMTIAQSGGIDAKTIADMFAQQFQAVKTPVLKNGQYIFSYTNNNTPTQVWVGTSGSLFMITAIGGNQKEGLDFIKNSFSNIKYPDLFPK